MRQFGLVESDLGWINIILVQRRWSEHSARGKTIDKRMVCEIAELVRRDETNHSTWELRPIFEWDVNNQKMVFKNESILAKEKFRWCFPSETWDAALKRVVDSFSLQNAASEKKQVKAARRLP